MRLKDLFAPRMVFGNRRVRRRLLGRGIKHYRHVGAARDLPNATEVAERMTQAGHPIVRQTVTLHANAKDLPSIPTMDHIEGYAQILGYPTGLVAVASLVSAGLAEDWVGDVVALAYAAVVSGKAPENLFDTLEALIKTPGNVVAFPTTPDLEVAATDAMKANAVDYLDQLRARPAVPASRSSVESSPPAHPAGMGCASRPHDP